MKHKRINMSAIATIALSVAAAWGQNAMAADGTQTTQDHAGHASHAVYGPASDEIVLKKGAAKTKTPAKKKSTMQDMDHSGMGHGAAAPTKSDSMSGMDHSKMGQGGMEPGATAPGKSEDMSGMDHGKMNQSAPSEKDDMKGMDHSNGGDNGDMSMQGGSAPPDARDPHAYSGGYDFGPIPRPRMADEGYMAGLMINRLERAQTRNSAFNVYDLQGWIGKDYDRLVLKAEGEVDGGKLREARTEILWGHAVSTYWNTQLGARYDSGVAPGRGWLAFGVQGLAPYWFEVDATAYIGDQGRTALRLGAEYELLITQKLILQPRIEANFYGKQDEARELGTGLTNLVTGVRLRYEIRREFAPYVGVDWTGKFGGTADYARAAGVRTNDTRVVAGVRLWF